MSRSSKVLSLVSILPLIAMGGLRAGGKETICHKAGPKHFITLNVGETGAAQHLATHTGDYLGECGVNPPPGGGGGGDPF